MKKIIVLGSNSYAGSCYINYLLNKNYRIYGFSRSAEPPKLLLKYKYNKNVKNFKFIRFDINNDLNFLNKFLKKNRVDYIIDFLGQGMVAESWLYPHHWYKTNILSKVKMYDLLSKNRRFKKYIRISTPEAIGQVNGFILEDTKSNPSTPYAISHLSQDLTLSAYFKFNKFPFVISLKTNFIKVMAEHGGHPIFTSIKTDIAQREEPFRYPIVSISEAHDFYGKKGTKGSLNELADALKRMKCVRLGECSHKPSGKAPILYVVRDFDFFKPKDKSEIARDFWLPIDVSNREKVGLDGSTKYDMSKFDVINVKTSLKKLNPDYIPEGEKRILNL